MLTNWSFSGPDDHRRMNMDVDAIVAEVMAYCQISSHDARELARLIMARLAAGENVERPPPTHDIETRAARSLREMVDLVISLRPRGKFQDEIDRAQSLLAQLDFGE